MAGYVYARTEQFHVEFAIFHFQIFCLSRYQFSKQQALKPEDFEEHGITVKKTGEVTLETEFEKIQTLDIDNWSNIRGPRPWEENPQKTH
jgi:cytochrome c oxidase assembly protein subunit 16